MRRIQTVDNARQPPLAAVGMSRNGKVEKQTVLFCKADRKLRMMTQKHRENAFFALKRRFCLRKHAVKAGLLHIVDPGDPNLSALGIE